MLKILRQNPANNNTASRYHLQGIQYKNFTQSPKWQIQGTKIKKNDLVIIEEPNIFSHKWPIGVVHPGIGGLKQADRSKLEPFKLQEMTQY
uniref:DUF5641 domain-containing protein n=1 Tax=Megaselia scalaris TaxID=36166 RepID=T1H3U1_MEGSC